MKIYCVGLYPEFPHPDCKLPASTLKYAHFSAIGTWVYERPPCEVCQWHWQIRVEPLLVQWEPGLSEIADFSYNGWYEYEFCVTDAVAECLERMEASFDTWRIQYVAAETPSKRRCVPFPYVGPHQMFPEANVKIELDREASGVTVKSICEACGDTRHTYRKDGIVIRKSAWSGEPMFRIRTNGRSAATFITEDLKRVIEERGFTTFLCREAGEIRD